MLIEEEHKKIIRNEKIRYLIYSSQSQTEIQNKVQKTSIPSTISSSIDEVSPTPSPEPKEQEHKRFNCFHCSQAYSSDKERVQHIDAEHPGNMYYPTPEDFEKRLL